MEAQSPTTAPSIDNPSAPLKRAVARRVFPKVIDSYSGTIVFDLCVDQTGNVIDANYNSTRSTLTNKEAIAEVHRALTKTKFEENIAAPVRECGQWTMKLDN